MKTNNEKYKGWNMDGKPRIEPLLEDVIKKKASDLHIQVGLPPMLRIDSDLITSS